MSIDQIFSNYFKPEIQKRGREDFAKGLAFISNASDTQIQGFVKAMPPLKVAFYSTTIASTEFSASCTCSQAAKGVYCKHMWTLLLTVEQKHPDFLDSKTDIVKNERVFKKAATPLSEKAQAYKEKQKAWAKEIRIKKKEKKSEPKPARERYADSIESALDFFTANGFVMSEIPEIETLKKAKKHLARVFHPDKGGTHEEAVILNKHFDVLDRSIEMMKK
jgi:hypothetical protein